jgi:cell fate regulator YaaT (PSP1 superfamily)
VAYPPVERQENSEGAPLKKVYRPATDTDLKQLEKNKDLEVRAFQYCRQCIDELDLEMNLFSIESSFDTSKLTFYFTADGRVDFRKLVKMLVREFRTKIEMRQVGIRNQAKMCGGIGRCGRELCCSAFMTRFDPVSIKMAKRQGLSLNPTKISGVCGRLMCCLTFENHMYGKPGAQAAENRKSNQEKEGSQ